MKTWIGVLCALVVAILVVGGITRLTHSGLSIVEWKPVTGMVPPLTDSAWQAEFLKYQQYPEYQRVNHGMTLAEFRSIYLWEYGHRLLGRLLGLAVLLPTLYLAFRRKLSMALGTRLGGAFVLVALQGLLGWYMVKSGLVEDPRVSHYRLAAHLLLALGLLVYLFRFFLDLARGRSSVSEAQSRPVYWRRGLLGLLVLLVIQAAYGAFTAGLRAGFGFNTFPTMNGEWVPDVLLRLESAWLNLFENPIAVQFIHRWLGVGVLAAVLALAGTARSLPLRRGERRGLLLLSALALLQTGLGVATLVSVVPIALAVPHQLVAALLLLAVVNLLHLAPIADHKLTAKGDVSSPSV
ncbi:MAG: COX15/CtaA family protein [Oligoflexia bacterium]|nr:COX15/CtaA family protein [Oligoflexia bacterium]